MGFRFRKSIKIIPGIRINLSKSGPSLSVGGRGLTTNLSARGTRTTVGIPGTGLSYSTTSNSSTEKSSGCLGFLLVGFGAIFIIGMITSIFSGGSSTYTPLSVPPPSAPKVSVMTPRVETAISPLPVVTQAPIISPQAKVVTEKIIPVAFTLDTLLPAKVILKESIMIMSKTDGVVGIGKGQIIDIIEKRTGDFVITFGLNEYLVPQDSIRAYIKK